MSDYHSTHVSGKPGHYRLMLREHASYGGADYSTLCTLTDSQASTLVASGLVTPWTGVTVEPLSSEQAEVEDVLVLRRQPDFPGLLEVVFDIPGLAEGTSAHIGEWFFKEIRDNGKERTGKARVGLRDETA